MLSAIENLVNISFIFLQITDVDYLYDTKLPLVLTNIFMDSCIPFIFIIDEWNCIFRIFKTDVEGQTKYLSFIGNLLKGKPYVALDHATVILPVKKYGQTVSKSLE